MSEGKERDKMKKLFLIAGWHTYLIFQIRDSASKDLQ